MPALLTAVFRLFPGAKTRESNRHAPYYHYYITVKGIDKPQKFDKT